MGADAGEVAALAKDLAAAPKKISPEVRKVVRSNADKVRDSAKAKARRRTGALQGSITVKGQGNGDSASATIEAGIRYGWFNEYGTSKMAPQPFMWPAVLEVAPGFQQELAEAMKEATL